jgi:hypothetical protein
MSLPSDFHFSQLSLQDYVDCRRRFQLRHLLRLPWPAIEAEPIVERERLLRLGATFHRMIQQHLLGLPVESLTSMAMDADLKRWWDNYLAFPLSDLPALQTPEVLLTAPLAGYRILAKYDLVAVDPGKKAVIVDWKTALRRPSRSHLAERLQTRVYRYLLVRAGAHLNDGAPIPASQVEMVYWFSEHPHAPERLPYDESQYHADEAYLTGLIEEILALGESDFELTSQESRCGYCPYRSLCERGVQAGVAEDEAEDLDTDQELDLELDFDQIAEIEF